MFGEKCNVSYSLSLNEVMPLCLIIVIEISDVFNKRNYLLRYKGNTMITMLSFFTNNLCQIIEKFEMCFLSVHIIHS